MDFDITGILNTIAPWIGTALGGPLGGMAVTALGSALGLSDPTMNAVKTAISGATPEQLAEIKKADQDFAMKMQELGFKEVTDIAALVVEDKKDARNMYIQNKSWMTPTLAVLITIGFFSTLTCLLAGWIHVGDTQVVLLMIGSLITKWGSVVDFNFGSTADSLRKTEMIAAAPAIDIKTK